MDAEKYYKRNNEKYDLWFKKNEWDDVFKLMEAYANHVAEAKCKQQKEIDVFAAHETGKVSGIKNAPLATDD